MSGDGVLKLFEYGEHSHQKEYPKDKVPNEQEPYHEGKAHMHNDFDSSTFLLMIRTDLTFFLIDADLTPPEDQRSLSNKLEAEENHVRLFIPAITTPHA
jgi:hypothetical protein